MLPAKIEKIAEIKKGGGMKREKRSRKPWRIKHNLKLLNYLLAVTTIFTLFIFSTLKTILTEFPSFFGLHFDVVIISMCFVVIVTAFVIILVILLHRSLGPVVQIEHVLDEVIGGNRSLRIRLRKKDLLHSLERKLNKVLDSLEATGKKQD